MSRFAPHHFLEEEPPHRGTIEHLRERELGLQDRDLLTVASADLRRREWGRQEPEPLADQALDFLGGHPVAKAWARFGLAHESSPLSSASKAMPACVNWR